VRAALRGAERARRDPGRARSGVRFRTAQAGDARSPRRIGAMFVVTRRSPRFTLHADAEPTRLAGCHERQGLVAEVPAIGLTARVSRGSRAVRADASSETSDASRGLLLEDAGCPRASRLHCISVGRGHAARSGRSRAWNGPRLFAD
jgi:hypothetical protein